MTKKAFDKIAEGLNEALEYVRDKELVRDTISLYYSVPYSTDHKAMATELSQQFHNFMDIAENAGYTVTKKEILRSVDTMTVEVEGKK